MLYLSLFLNVILVLGLLALGFTYYRNSRKVERLLKTNAEKERLRSELQLASQIQRSMMPMGHQVLDGVDVFGSLVPAREMGGDLFDYGVMDGKLYFCIWQGCPRCHVHGLCPLAVVELYAWRKQSRTYHTIPQRARQQG